MLKEQAQSIEKPKSQIEVDKNITDFLGDMPIKTSNDFVNLSVIKHKYSKISMKIISFVKKIIMK